MKNNKYIYIVLCSLGFIACEPEFDQPLEDNPITQERGTADFSTYVALGNSLTAGFADGALYSSGQEVGFVNLIANKMKAAGGGDFTIPFMNDNVGGFAGFENGFGTRLVIQTDENGNRGPARLNNNVATNDIAARAEGSNFNNLGVPGITSFQFNFEGLGNPAGLTTNPVSANPYFTRFASSPTTSILADALAKQPTFFTLWLGNNDVLGYATSGGTGVDQTGNPNPATYGGNDITDPGVFNALLNGFSTALTANGASGLLVNIPNVTDIPFFTTVPNNALVLSAEQAALLTSYFQGYVGILTFSAAPAQIEEAVIAEATRIITEAVTEAVTEATIAGRTEAEITAIAQQTETAATAAVMNPAALQAIQDTATPIVLERLGQFLNQYAFQFQEGQNRFLINVPVTSENPQGLRQMTEDELLLLTIDQNALRNLGYGSIAVTPEVLDIAAKLQAFNAGTSAPPTTEEGLTYLNAVNAIDDQDALDTDELTAISTAVTSYNQTLETIADSNPNIALYDANADLATLSSGGITSRGVTITSTLVTGGGFSLDGVHLSPRGNAVIANRMIEAINSNFNSTLQPVEPSLFTFIPVP